MTPPPEPRFRGPFWRVLPWDPAAAPGEPFTPEYVMPSAFRGEWHVAVVFLDRALPAEIRYGRPEALHLGHAVVLAAAEELRVRVVPPAARRVLPTPAAAPARRSPPTPPNP